MSFKISYKLSVHTDGIYNNMSCSIFILVGSNASMNFLLCPVGVQFPSYSKVTVTEKQDTPPLFKGEKKINVYGTKCLCGVLCNVKKLHKWVY